MRQELDSRLRGNDEESLWGFLRAHSASKFFCQNSRRRPELVVDILFLGETMALIGAKQVPRRAATGADRLDDLVRF